MPRFHPSTPRGYSKARLRRTRTRRNYKGWLEIHHVVPREFRKHPVLLRYNYDVEGDYNTIFLPSSRAPSSFAQKRPVHTGGHPAYNRRIGAMLDDCNGFAVFCVMLTWLHRGVRGRGGFIPWR